jgi:hypothetical protein
MVSLGLDDTAALPGGGTDMRCAELRWKHYIPITTNTNTTAPTFSEALYNY